jgi:sugar phosphate isomerase/epimerase
MNSEIKDNLVKDINRRNFLQSAVLAGSGLAMGFGKVAEAASPQFRNGKPYMKLSLAAYSFNRVLPRSLPLDKYNKAKMGMAEFVDYCAELDLDGTELTSYYFPESVSNDFLINLKQQCFRLGLDISGTAIGNDFCLPEGAAREEQLAMTRTWIDNAAVLGAPVIRIFAGKIPNGETEEIALERCINGINESLKYAAQKGVVLALENHGGITATPEQMLRIVEGVDNSPWFGVNFDSGNFRTADPYGDLEKIAPYTMNAQIKVMMHPEGGDPEPADLKRIINILKAANYRGYIVLEYEEKEDPKTVIPGYLDELRNAIAG